MSQAGFVMGFVHRRRRGAELFLLILALAVGIGAYAAVGIGVEGEVPPDIVGYGAWLAALAIAAHVVVRIVAPYADPVLLPVVAALNGLGLAVIHRLDLAYADNPLKPHGLPHKQLIWMTLGVVLFIATLVLLRDHRVLTSGSPTPAGWPRSCCCCCRCVPGVGDTINGARIWISVGPFSFQPGEVAKVLLVIAFAGYLVLHRDALALAGRRVALHRPAARPRPRPDPGDVADQPRHPGLPARPRLQPAVLRPLPGDALRRHRAARLAGRRRRAVRGRRRAWPTSSSRTSRTASTSGSTR